MEKSSFKEIIEKNPIHYFEYKVTTVESVLETTLSYFRQKLVCLLCISTRPRTMNYQEVDEFYLKCKSRNAMMTWRGLQPNGMVIPKLVKRKQVQGDMEECHFYSCLHITSQQTPVQENQAAFGTNEIVRSNLNLFSS